MTTTIPTPLSPVRITRLGYGRACCACQSIILPGELSWPTPDGRFNCTVCHGEREAR